MYVDLHVKCCYFCLNSTQLKRSLQIVVEASDIKVKKMPVTRSQFLCGLAGRQTDRLDESNSHSSQSFSEFT